MVFKS